MADIFSVIADPTRRELLRLLLERRRVAAVSPPSVRPAAAVVPAREISVGEMVTALGLSQPTVSKHLRVLRESGLVHVREEGQHRYYRLDETPLRDVELWLQPFLLPPEAPRLAIVPAASTARPGPVAVPAPLRRAAENLPDAGDVGTSLGRAVAQAQSRILDPVKKRLAHRDPG
jgi:ArsR family transcriptional regulator